MPVAQQRDNRREILDVARRIIAHKGYAAVGLNEVLTGAGVPKGSFYHYFSSKDAFGEAMLNDYFAGYVVEMDLIFADAGRPAAERLMDYWRHWHGTQSLDACQGSCLAVKLGAEVADLSEPLRRAVLQGTSAVIDRIERIIVAGQDDGSLTLDADAHGLALTLYDTWLGASVMAKIRRDRTPLDNAMQATVRALQL